MLSSTREERHFFIDSMCIPANAKNKEAAEMFINYLCEPDVGLANADFIGYSTPITAVWEMLDDDLKYSEIAYPSAEVLDKAEVFETLPRRPPPESPKDVLRADGSHR